MHEWETFYVILGSSAAALTGLQFVVIAVGVANAPSSALGYTVWVVLLARRQTGYAPVLEDWIWHTGLPMLAYAVLFIAGLSIRSRPAGALYFVGATALLLLYVGIHNAWDAALWMWTQRKK